LKGKLAGMSTFATVDDDSMGARIDKAIAQVVYVSPGVGKVTAAALIRASARERVAVTIILDADEDAYRIGYGDPEALGVLHDAMTRHGLALRRQPGVRIGLAIVDDDLVIWSPTARSVESERSQNQPNAIVLSGAAVHAVESAVGAEGSKVLPGDAEIGRQALRPQETEDAIRSLKENPPAPFDLARRTRVFSSKFQFVEFEIRGAEWTQRRLKLSNLLLNADLPEAIQDLLETQVRPFQNAADRAFPVPHLVCGQPAFHMDGTPMVSPATQAQIVKAWEEIRDTHLRHLKGFGWLIRRDRLESFKTCASAYEETLKAWVAQFRKHVASEETQIVQSIAASIRGRLERSVHQEHVRNVDLSREIKKGLDRLRVIEPRVRTLLKNVSWESSRDDEFLNALKAALDPEELHGWFEEFVAARQRGNRDFTSG